jgi:hypothetical protein
MGSHQRPTVTSLQADQTINGGFSIFLKQDSTVETAAGQDSALLPIKEEMKDFSDDELQEEKTKNKEKEKQFEERVKYLKNMLLSYQHSDNSKQAICKALTIGKIEPQRGISPFTNKPLATSRATIASKSPITSARPLTSRNASKESKSESRNASNKKFFKEAAAEKEVFKRCPNGMIKGVVLNSSSNKKKSSTKETVRPFASRSGIINSNKYEDVVPKSAEGKQNSQKKPQIAINFQPSTGQRVPLMACLQSCLKVPDLEKKSPLSEKKASVNKTSGWSQKYSSCQNLSGRQNSSLQHNTASQSQFKATKTSISTPRDRIKVGLLNILSKSYQKDSQNESGQKSQTSRYIGNYRPANPQISRGQSRSSKSPIPSSQLEEMYQNVTTRLRQMQYSLGVVNDILGQPLN